MKTAEPVVILGAGYTGSRVAARLRERGMAVRALHRTDLDLLQPGALERLPEFVPEGATVLHSIPSLENRADARLAEWLRARRVVYLSTTGVYGAAVEIDERTPAEGRDERARARLETEEALRSGPWETLILRPAAIYGPGRGAHVSIPEGRYRIPGDGGQYISRIHVDDLAAIAEAGLLAELTGTYPVADDHPCTSLEIASYCAELMKLPLPPFAPVAEVERSRRSNRRVDGRAIRAALGVALRYPTYREGIAASLGYL